MNRSLYGYRVSFLAVFLFAIGCGSDDNTTSPSEDSVNPSSVTNLVATVVDDFEVRLSWTATGDDGIAGQASFYDIRYGDSALGDATWEDATSFLQPPTPRVSGATETALVTDLAAGRWYFALKAGDEIPNWSLQSNVVSATVGDSILPASVTDLFAENPRGDEIVIDWTAPGDDGDEGQADEYELRYALEAITIETWTEATPIENLAPPAVAGTRETVTVSLPVGSVYYFALRTRDNGSNWSGLSNIASVSTTLDGSAPAAVLDVTVLASTGRTVTLQWTAPGDDGSTGQATEYDVQYSEADDWSTPERFSNVSRPRRAGFTESMTLSGLEPRSSYFVRLRTADEVGNWSEPSNVATFETGSFWRLQLSGAEPGAVVSSPTWSPDGTRIAYSRSFDGSSDIYVVSSEGGTSERLTDTSDARSPRWSPFGDKIAFTRRGSGNNHLGLWTLDVAGGTPTQIVEGQEFWIGWPTWSPDGKRVAYQDPALSSAATTTHIMVVSSTGGEPTILVPGGEDWGNFYPSWSPNGDRMAIVSTQNNYFWEIWVVNLSEGTRTQLVGSPWSRSSFWPTWSPDGSELIFRSRRVSGGRSYLYRVSADGGGEPEQLTGGLSGFSPEWSPLGDRIAYGASADDESSIWIQLVD